MTTETFTFLHTAGLPIYFRLFDDLGQVFDFDDATFKALTAATEPYLVATERQYMDGTGRSGYTCALDLADVYLGLVPKRYVLQAYAAITPATEDLAVSSPMGITIQAGEIGEKDVIVKSCLSVKSTEGAFAQISIWIEHGGRKVDIAALDPAATASIQVREHGSGLDLFTAAAVAGDLILGVFQIEQESPGFTDDRQYQIVCSITMNGVTYSATEFEVVIG